MITLLAKLLPAAWPIWAAEAIFWALAAIGGTTAVILFWHTKVADPYITHGKALQLAADQPVIAKLTGERDQARGDLKNAKDANATMQKSVATLEGKLEEANASIENLKTVAERARAQARKAIADIQAQARRDADEIARLTAVANGPPVVEACAKAADYLSQLATWRRAP